MQLNSTPARGLAPVILAVVIIAGLFAVTDSSKAASPKTVTISGKAYRFNHMDTPLPGATIRVREFPKLSAKTETNGDYVLTVPNDRNVTPYIESGTIPPGTDPMTQHYNEIDLQTFHPRGENIVNANFQAPTDFEYTALKGILQVPARADGRPEQCAIVTTSSARNVRGVSYETFWDRTPHGVEGATATAVPSLIGPTYFNEHVIPDKTKTSSSNDGGIIWEIVPAGTYRIITSHPTTRFASFLATCENGRVVNANPPWGAYELAPGEKPLAASNVAANFDMTGTAQAVVGKKGKKRLGKRHALAYVNTAERVDVVAKVIKGGKQVGAKKTKIGKPGMRMVWIPVASKAKRGKAKVTVKLTDASGVSFTTTRHVSLPKPPKAKKRR